MPKAALVQRLEEERQVGHISCRLLERIPGLGLLAVHALVRPNPVDTDQTEDFEDARLNPERRAAGVLM